MSRFFRGGSSDSSSDDDSYDYSSTTSESSEDETQLTTAQQRGSGKFVRGATYSDSSSEEDVKRVVKSTKEKRLDEFRSHIKALQKYQEENDWVSISSEFDKLNKLLVKSSHIFASTPKIYIAALVKLDDFLKDVLDQEKDAKKKMNATNAKSLNVIKQKFKKHTKSYEKEMEEYRENPYISEEENDKAEESDDSYFDSTEESETESSESEAEKPKGINKWLKKDVIKKEVKKVEKKQVPRKAVVEDESRDLEDKGDGFTTVGKAEKSFEVGPENFLKKLREIVEARGKKSTDRFEQVRILRKLLGFATTPYQKVRVLLILISSQFDVFFSMTGYMNIEIWRRAEKDINELLTILEEHPKMMVGEMFEDIDEDEQAIPTGTDSEVKISGSVMSLIERLDEEFTKSLQNIDPHTTDYVDRLKDETNLYSTIVRAQLYFERTDLQDSLCRCIIRRLEHLYFKPDHVIRTVEDSVKKTLDNSSKITSSSDDSSDLLNSLCVYIYKHSDSYHRTKAMLFHIYNHALHNRFYTARDMMLMSHLQDTISQADISTQILHNRTMVQLGLCAFRQGMIKELHLCLQELYNTNRVKELLAQGVQNQRHGALEPEIVDKQRQLPFHMHINLELLECIFLVTSMLLEIPSMAAIGSHPDAKKRVISKPFRRMLDFSERQLFIGPPENTRDYIMAASKALAVGDWKKCLEMISSIKIWNLLPNSSEVIAMLSSKIQEEGLRTYLFTYSPHYSSIGISHLASMFELSMEKVTSIISKMIWNDEISATLDQVTNVLIFHRVELSKLQSLGLHFSEKASVLVDFNERNLEYKMTGDASALISSHASSNFGADKGKRGGMSQMDSKYGQNRRRPQQRVRG